jgi:hypothetical protein
MFCSKETGLSEGSRAKIGTDNGVKHCRLVLARYWNSGATIRRIWNSRWILQIRFHESSCSCSFRSPESCLTWCCFTSYWYACPTQDASCYVTTGSPVWMIAHIRNWRDLAIVLPQLSSQSSSCCCKTSVSFGRMDLANFKHGQFLLICDSRYCEICNLNHHPQVQFGDLEARCSRRAVCFRVSFGRTHVQTLRLHRYLSTV